MLNRHPGLTIENCASGGMRADYAMLSRLQQGLVLQQAWDPELDIDGYLGAVIALIDRFTAAPH